MRTPDALQVETAIISGCNAFLTNNFGLKRIRDVQYSSGGNAVDPGSEQRRTSASDHRWQQSQRVGQSERDCVGAAESERQVQRDHGHS